MEGGSSRLMRKLSERSGSGNTPVNLLLVYHGNSELTGGLVIGGCSSGMASFLDIVVWGPKIMGCIWCDGGSFGCIHCSEQWK